MDIFAILQKRETGFVHENTNSNDRTSLIIKLMRISLAVTILLMVSLQLFALTGKGQSIATEKVTLGLKDESLETAIKKIEQQSAFRFFYRNTDIRPLAHLDLAPGTRTIEQTLSALLENSCLSFRQIDNKILLERKEQQTSFEIKGRVVDSLDKKPVANASVFLSNASVGSNTASDGTFTLQNAKPGKYELIVSIIGYETYRKTIIVNDRNIVLRDIEISRKMIALNEVKIKAHPQSEDDRQKYLWWFTNEFLGTYLAEQCKILNPEVINLDYDAATTTLTASSDDFIMIENQALGYKIKYLLTTFIQEMNIQKVHYEGSALFENLKGTTAQQGRWQKERKEVYEGSMMHFLRSLPGDRLDEEGFRVLQYPKYNNPRRGADSLINAKIKFYKSLTGKNDKYRDSLTFWEKEAGLPKTFQTLMPFPLKRDDIAVITDQKGIFALGCDYDALLITYNKKHHFAAKGRLDNLASTILNFNDPYILFDRNGGIVDPGSISFTGAWGRDRLAELLPIDYDPQQNINNTDGNAVEQYYGNQLSSTQSNYLEAGLLKLKAASDSINDTRASEKAYMQFDKPYYAIGDTIWFKAYLLNAAYLTASDKSGFMYIDIANDSNKVVKQYKLPVQEGLSWGNINLDEKEFAAGTYTLRAYTSWMRNFGDNDFFYKQFYISSANENNWLINKQESVLALNGSNSADVKLQFSNMNKKPFIVESLDLQVVAGDRHLHKQKFQTDLNGMIDVNFAVPQKTSGLAIVAENENGRRAVIPINLNRPENADVQFLPEGGNLVAGLPAHIGFKAIGEDGRSINVSGIVTDHDQKKVVAFRSLHNGMGSFDLTIKNGEIYTAKITLPGGTIKEYQLPVVKSSGTILQVKNLAESDSLEVFVTATNDIVQSGNSYFLIGKASGVIAYAAIINFKRGSYVKRNIAKDLFPSGITHFTLTTTKYQPLNERLVFIDHRDNLNIKFKTNKVNYGPRDSVALQVKVTDNTGKPVAGNFSLSVTNDALVKIDTLNNENMITRLLLTADLKGFVEEPGYYLSSTTKNKWLDLDNLLLTQGWVGYNWREVFNPPVITYQPEHEFAVTGNVINVFNKPVRGTDVLLFSKIPSILMDTVTDKDGKFTFQHFPAIDTPIFIIKAVNRHGKSFNVGINVDDIKLPLFTRSASPVITPWYINSDTTLLNYTKNDALAKQLQYFPKGLILKEVKITAKKIVKGSQNLNGPGNADLVLDEKDMEKAGKKTWLDLLYENIKGFREGALNYVSHVSVPISSGSHLVKDVITNLTTSWYYVKDKKVVFIIDGIQLDSALSMKTISDFKDYLNSHNAEDIKGIELNFSLKYATEYIIRFIPPEKRPIDLTTIAYIEITTRSGHGPFLDNTPGVYLYKPLPISWPKKFYKPKYTLKDAAGNLPDLRSTIDWEPNITTDANGEATLSFYTVDKPSTYTLTIEGTDMSGSLGYKQGKIIVSDGKSVSK